MTKAPKKKDLEKCFVCTHSYKAEEVDEHMNGITHHLVLEQLYKKSRPHHCLVCGCVWKGLAAYRQHVGSIEHKKKVAELVKKRRQGTQVSLKYTTPPDLINLCKERNRLNSQKKAKKRQEKIKARKAKKQEQFLASKQTQLATTHQHQHLQQNKENKNSMCPSLDSEPSVRSVSPDSPTSPLNREWHGPALHEEVSGSQAEGGRTSRAGSVCSEPQSSQAAVAKEQRCSEQSVASCQQRSASRFSEIDFSLDFTSDLLPPVGALLFASAPAVKAEGLRSGAKDNEHSGALSREGDAKQNTSLQGGRSQHASGSRKRPLSQREGQPGSSAEKNRQEDSPRAPGLVKAHVQHISTILRRIRKSLDEEGLANAQAPSTSATGNSEDGKNRIKKLKTAHCGDGNGCEERVSVGLCDGSLLSSATMEPASECEFVQSSEKPEHEDRENTHSDSRETLHSRPSSKSSSNSIASGVDQLPSSQNRLGLPELLKRDLSRLGGKGGAHEPNLTAARRVRTFSSLQAGEAEKEAPTGPGLKPTLQKLFNSTAAKRKVNWKELYQEYHRRKRLREKGMPRFGIELVSPVMPLPDDLHLEEIQDLPLGEGFQWDSVDFDTSCPPGSYKDPPPEEPHPGALGPSARQVKRDAGPQGPAVVTVKIEKDDWDQWGQDPPPAIPACQGAEDRVASNQEIPDKDRRVDELLAVSLREEELSHSLLTLDDSLSQARSALQAAYVKVQRLMMVREQTTSDISALRAKRIEILKFMRAGGGGSDDAEKRKAKPSSEGRTQPQGAIQPAPVTPSNHPDVAPSPTPSSLGLGEPAQPPIAIKEEPVSPMSCHRDPETLSVSL